MADDQSDTVEERGQKLARVERKPAAEEASEGPDRELTDAERRANLMPPEEDDDGDEGDDGGDEESADPGEDEDDEDEGDEGDEGDQTPIGDGKEEPLDDEAGAATAEPEASTHPSSDEGEPEGAPDGEGAAPTEGRPKGARAAAPEDTTEPVASGGGNLKSLDDVLEKHAAGRKKKATKKKGKTPRQRAMEERQAERERKKAKAPKEEEKPEVWTSDTPIPTEDAPEHRDRMTIEDIEPADGIDFPDLSGRAPPTNLTDLCQTYPIGNGQHYVRVERTKPPAYLNQPTAGYLCDLHAPISESQFQSAFGGREYQLIVYGPDPKGTTDRRTGMPKVKALTKPIKLTVPGNPNLEFDPQIDLNPRRRRQEDDDMDPFDYTPRRPPRRPATPPSSAEAAMHKSNLEFVDKQIQRTEQDAERARREAEEARKSASSSLNPALEAVERASKGTVETLRHQLDDMKASFDKLLTTKDEENRALRDKIDQLMSRPSSEDSAMSAFAQMAKAFAPSERSSQEMTRIYEQQRSEIQRIEDAHKAEMTRQREHMENALRYKDDEVKHERERHEEEKRRMAEDHAKRERELREERDKAVREAEDRHQREIQRLREDHDRELKAVERQHNMVLETRKATTDVQMSALQERAAGLERERDRAVAEKAEASDFTTQIAEFEQRAQILGFQKANENEPRDWKERIAAAAGHALMNLDKVVAPIADAQARSAAARQLPPAQQQQGADAGGAPGRDIRGRTGRIRARRATSWASGEGDVSEAEEHTYYPHAHAPQQQAPDPGSVRQAEQQAAQQPPGQPQPQGQPTNGAGQPQAHPEEDGLNEEERLARDQLKAQIEMLRVFIESAINAGADPEQAADQLLRQATPDQVFALVHSVTADTIIEELSQDPKTQQSPIVRPNGQKWLRRAWEAAQRKSAAARQAQQAEKQPG